MISWKLLKWLLHSFVFKFFKFLTLGYECENGGGGGGGGGVVEVVVDVEVVGSSPLKKIFKKIFERN